MQKFSFDQEEIDVDVCVVGGGMSGICAAISAARNGAKTLLIQDRHVLGGNASSEVRMWICGAHGSDNRETGILEELKLKNVAINPLKLYNTWDHVLYGECQRQENLQVLMTTSVMDVTTENDTITSVKAWHLTQQKFYQVTAKQFIDSSGDSVLRTSGAHFRWGREARDEFNESHAPEVEDKKTMGNSILIQLRKTDRHVPFVIPDWAHHYTEETAPKRNLSTPGDNFWWLEIGGMSDTIANADEIRDELLRIAYGVWGYIKNHSDGRGEKWELYWIGALPGKRENVRYEGDLILNQNHVEAEGRFDDIVAFGGWSMDDHHPEAIEYPGDPTIFHPAPSPYGIPYRSLYSRNIKNLFFSGRNISATHMAMSSTRVMGTTSIMGQAAGTAAALCIRHDASPRDIYEQYITELQETLMEQDCYLPWKTRDIPALTKVAKLEAEAENIENLHNGIERVLGDDDNGVWLDNGKSIAYNWDSPQTIQTIRLLNDSDLKWEKKMPSMLPKKDLPQAMPKMMLKNAQVRITKADGSLDVIDIKDNDKRLLNFNIDSMDVVSVALTNTQAWGMDRSHIFSFDVK